MSNEILVTNLNILELLENVDGNVGEIKDMLENTDQNVPRMSGKFILFILFFNRTAQGIIKKKFNMLNMVCSWETPTKNCVLDQLMHGKTYFNGIFQKIFLLFTQFDKFLLLHCSIVMKTQSLCNYKQRKYQFLLKLFCFKTFKTLEELVEKIKKSIKVRATQTKILLYLEMTLRTVCKTSANVDWYFSLFFSLYFFISIQAKVLWLSLSQKNTCSFCDLLPNQFI